MGGARASGTKSFAANVQEPRPHLARERSKGESRSGCLPLSLPSSRLCAPLASRGAGPVDDDSVPLPCLRAARHAGMRPLHVPCKGIDTRSLVWPHSDSWFPHSCLCSSNS